jgi:ParB/RepB/Spo0J family partition protein
METNATFIGKLEMNKSFQKIEISRIETSKEIEKIYDYINRESEIKTLENSIKEFGQLQPITVVYKNGKYLITDGVLRFNAIKNLNLDYIEVIIIQYIETEQTDFTDFIIHNQIKKVKSSKEKLNEVIYTLRIGEIKTNPNRDKDSRVKF